MGGKENERLIHASDNFTFEEQMTQKELSAETNRPGSRLTGTACLSRVVVCTEGCESESDL